MIWAQDTVAATEPMLDSVSDRGAFEPMQLLRVTVRGWFDSLTGQSMEKKVNNEALVQT